MPLKTPRIEDVAKAAGVSTATVSRALSNPDLVSEHTRNQVLEAVKSTGYRVNKAARNLRKRQAGAVLILVPNLSNPFFSEILAGISAMFAETEYSVLIADTNGREELGKTIQDYLSDSQIDGLLCLDGGLSAKDLAQLEASSVAGKIVFACEWVHGTPYPSVRSDNAKGARLAIQHLYDLGHQDIAHITGPKGNVLTRERRNGVLEQRSKLNLPAREDWIIRGDFSLASGFKAAHQIATMRHQPSAVFCASDMVAIGLISGLKQHGMSVPVDISVIGFDDINFSAYALPALTTISQDRIALGQRAAKQLLGRMQPADYPGETTDVDLVDVRLTIRQSTRAWTPLG